MKSNCTIFPTEATAGLNFQATVVSAAYPSPEWTLTAILRGPEPIDLTATADGALHTFTATAATTAAWKPGLYVYAIRATNGTDVFEVATGQLQVHPDLAAVTGEHDARSENEIALEAIKAVLARRATIDQERYRINNRELYRTPIADLIKLRAYYANEVRKEKRKGCGGNWGRKIPVRFSA